MAKVAEGFHSFEHDEEDASDPHPQQMPLAPVDLPRIERAVREILISIGENPDREGLKKTPKDRKSVV